MTERMPEKDDRMQAAEYVLGTLPAAERAAFAARLGFSATLRAEVAKWERHLSAFNADYAEAAPPPALRGALEQRLFGAAEPRGLWHSLNFWRGFGLVAVAGLVLAVAVPLAFKPAPQSNLIAELAGEAKAVKLAVTYDEASATIRYVRLDGAPLSGRDFELWAIIGKNAPVSLGVLATGQSGTIKIPPALAAQMAEAILAISDEPKGGSPTGQPTGAVLSTGKLTRV